MSTIPDPIWIDDDALEALPSSTDDASFEQLKFIADVPIGRLNVNEYAWDESIDGPIPDDRRYRSYSATPGDSMHDFLYHHAYPSIRTRFPEVAGPHPYPHAEDSFVPNQAMMMAIAYRQLDGAEKTAMGAKLVSVLEQALLSEATQYAIGYSRITRQISGYFIAADIAKLKSLDPSLDGKYRVWANYARNAMIYERYLDTDDTTLLFDRVTSIKQQAWERPNNHGLTAIVSYLTLSIFAGDAAAIDAVAAWYRSWVGETKEHTGFRYKYVQDGWWHPDINDPLGIARLGATIEDDGTTYDMDGVMAEEARRCSYETGFRWPPCITNYYWTNLQWVIALVYLLERCGIPAMEYGDFALQRAVDWILRSVWVTIPTPYGYDDLATETGYASQEPGDPSSFDPLNPGAKAPFIPGMVFHSSLDNDVDAIYLLNYLLNHAPTSNVSTLKTLYPNGKNNDGYYPTLWERDQYGKQMKAPSASFYLFRDYTSMDNKHQDPAVLWP